MNSKVGCITVRPGPASIASSPHLPVIRRHRDLPSDSARQAFRPLLISEWVVRSLKASLIRVTQIKHDKPAIQLISCNTKFELPHRTETAPVFRAGSVAR